MFYSLNTLIDLALKMLIFVKIVSKAIFQKFLFLKTKQKNQKVKKIDHTGQNKKNKGKRFFFLNTFTIFSIKSCKIWGGVGVSVNNLVRI